MHLRDFIGQKHIVKQITGIMNTMTNWNILLRGFYGSGKTTLALLIAGIFGMYSYQLPVDGNIMLGLGNIQIVDEAHLLRRPERLYQIMEQNNFIFCSNMDSLLPEAFLSRCYSFRMDDYTQDEIASIIMVNTNCSPGVARFVSSRCKENPRIGVNLTRQYLGYCKTFGQYPIEQMMLDNGLDEYGFDSIDRKYLSAVSSGPKSKQTLRSILNIDTGELIRREQYLIRKGYVGITSKGREYNG